MMIFPPTITANPVTVVLLTQSAVEHQTLLHLFDSVASSVSYLHLKEHTYPDL